jgi:hypothetical protein
MFRATTPALEKLAYFEVSNPCHEASLPIRRPEPTSAATDGCFRLRPVFSSSNHAREPTSPVPADEIKSGQKHLAAEAVMLYPVLRPLFIKHTEERRAQTHAHYIPYVAELVQPHSLDWPNDGLLRRTQSLIMGMVLWGALMTYGAIHVAAWDYFFPSPLEQLF